MGGLVADLGLSSDQLDDPERGLSFRFDGPLDMRLDRSSGGPTAGDLLRELTVEDLASILFRFGDEPRARRIARLIVERRREEAIVTTHQLRALVEAATPAREARTARIHPATRTFQALRIAVNAELEGLDSFVRDAARCLAPGGRLVVISFHGGEDRAIKNALRDLSGRCTCPPAVMRCECGRRAVLKVLTRKPIAPTDAEVTANPRSRSARMRAAEKLPAA